MATQSGASSKVQVTTAKPLLMFKTLNTVTLQPLSKCTAEGERASKNDMLDSTEEHQPTVTRCASYLGPNYIIGRPVVRSKTIAHGVQRSASMQDAACSFNRRLTPGLSPRHRPRLPAALLSPSQSSDNNVNTEDLDILLKSLCSTDFVQKYGRRGSRGDGWSPPASVPTLSPSGYLSPSTELKHSDHLIHKTLALKSVKSKLEQVKASQENEEKCRPQKLLMPDGESSVVGRGTSGATDNTSCLNVCDRSTGPEFSDNGLHPGEKCCVNSSIIGSPPKSSQSLLDSAQCGVAESLSDGKITKHSSPSSDPMRGSSSFAQPAVSAGQIATAKSFPGYDFSSCDNDVANTKLDNNRLAVEVMKSPLNNAAFPVEAKNNARLRPTFSLSSSTNNEDDVILQVIEEEFQDSEQVMKQSDDEGMGSSDHENLTYQEVLEAVMSEPKGQSTEISQDTVKALKSTLEHSASVLPAALPESLKQQDETASRLYNGRFQTHPPLTRERVTPLPSSIDSNGLQSLHDPAYHKTADVNRYSTVSISSVDSHLCSSSETTETPPCYGVSVEVTSESQDSSGFQRRNSKAWKQKSRSDPTGGTTELAQSLDLSAVLSVHTGSVPSVSSFVETASVKEESSSDSRKTSEKSLSSNSTVTGDDTLCVSASDSPVVIARSIPKRVLISTAGSDSSSCEEKQRLVEIEPRKRPSKKRFRNKPDVPKIKELALEKIPKLSVTKKLISFGSKDSKHKQDAKDKENQDSDHSRGKNPDSDHSRGKQSKHLFPKVKDIASYTYAKPAVLRSHSSASVVLHKSDSSKTLLDRGLSTPPAVRARTPSGESNCQGSPEDSASQGRQSGRTKPDKPGFSLFAPALDPIYSSTLSLFEGCQENKNKRDFIVQEFYNSEKQYVESLQFMVEKYMIPLKTQGVLDSNIVDEIFYKVNELYMHHATFMAFLGRAIANWNTQSTIGDVIYKTFTKETVIESYMLFIENFPKAEKALDEISSKSSFQKFIEQVEKEGRIKLPLKAQVVKPAQRIPRYELLIKRMLDHTTNDHPDYKFLKEAEGAIHSLALKINSVKESKHEEGLQETLKKLEVLLMTDLVAPERQYLKHDTLPVLESKEPCCVWLFTDLLVLSTNKRKTGTLNKKPSLLLQSPLGHDFVENTKQRLWFKLALDDVEITKSASSPTDKPLVDRDQLQHDQTVLREMSELARHLACSHNSLDTTLDELLTQVNQTLTDAVAKDQEPQEHVVELVATAPDGVMVKLSVVFPTADKKSQWEVLVKDTKEKLAKSRDAKPPEFVHSLQITKTRAGMQFSCSSPIEGTNSKGYQDVWVCNSDGYVGHMCLLSLQPEPIVSLNTPLPGCNSRILCICAVPALPVGKSHSHRHQPVQPVNPRRRQGVTHPPDTVFLLGEGLGKVEEAEDGYTSESSSTSSDSDLEILRESESSHSLDATKIRQSVSPSHTTSHTTSLSDPLKSTMWLGTEDGCIHIFQSVENIKTTKNKVKVQLSSAVLCIIHMEQQVFVSLANGDIIIYSRDKDGSWDTKHGETLPVGAVNAPIVKMLPVAGKLWCATGNDIVVVDPVFHQAELTFTGNPHPVRPGIHSMVCSGQAVWVAGEYSSRVACFHATSYILLFEVNVAQAVQQKLSICDEIIRQHKLACLRITSLLVCKDLLWIGTSAGVIVTIPIPKGTIMHSSRHSSVPVPIATGLLYGHTGHVRFLTCVDNSLSTSRSNDIAKTLATQPRRRMSTVLRTFSLMSRYVVISGGDGHEDYRSTGNAAQGNNIGKDDSTNHLLLWQV